MLLSPTGACQESLQDCSRWMFDNKYSCDVSFRARNNGNNGVLVKAHKFILIARSPVFRAMFCGLLAGDEKVIDVPDVPVEHFEEFLRFLYCDEVNLDNSNVFELLYCSKKYMITNLEVQCLSYVRENLDVENVCSILNYSLRYDEEELTDDCVKFIKAYTEEVFKSQAFLECNMNVLKVIVEQEVLNVKTECDVLEALFAWAGRCCEMKDVAKTPGNLRKVLGPMLFCVRMSLLQSNILNSQVISTGLLDEEEESALLSHIRGTCEKECLFLHTERFFLEQAHQCLLAEGRTVTCSFLAGNKMNIDMTTNSSIRILSVDVLQVDMIVPVGVFFVVSVIKDGECVGKVGVDKCRRPRIKDKEDQGRTYINVPFLTPVEVDAGSFTIEVCVQSCHNFVTIATANPRRQEVTQGGVTLAVTSETSTCLRSLHYAFGV